jgi:NitT/TauT family transport system permease protein
MWNLLRPRAATLRLWQVMVLVVIFVFWWAMTTPGVIPPFMFENDRQAAFFFGEPIKILARIWAWFITDHDIYEHLWVTSSRPCWRSSSAPWRAW